MYTEIHVFGNAGNSGPETIVEHQISSSSADDQIVDSQAGSDLVDNGINPNRVFVKEGGYIDQNNGPVAIVRSLRCEDLLYQSSPRTLVIDQPRLDCCPFLWARKA